MSQIEHVLSNIVFLDEETMPGGWDLYCKGSNIQAFTYVAKNNAEEIDAETGHSQNTNLGIRFSGSVDFFTYFNACSLAKWKKYARIDNVFLQFEISSLDCTIQWFGRSASDKQAKQITEGVRLVYGDWVELSPDKYWVNISLPQVDDEVVGFVLQTRESTVFYGGSYRTFVDETAVNPVHLSLCTTTFKKEEYILPNIAKVKNEILLSDEPIAEHFEMFVVDNGQTLDVDALQDQHVRIIPNKNVGGAGGFARGMMESMAADTPITHVLLMDDDVSISTESIKRTFNLLSLAQGKYKDAFINGAMLSLNEPNRQFEDVSYVKKSGAYHKIKPDLYVNNQADIVENESIDVEVSNAYGAWWFSCIPVKKIKEIGLPLPLFVRCDDVDYGMRANPTYMTMNGICVWHESFEGRFRPSVDCYQYVRNFLIAIAVDDIANEDLFMVRVDRNIRLNLRFMAYDTVELFLDAVEDYLKGPEFIKVPQGDEIMKRNGAKNEQMNPIAFDAENAVVKDEYIKDKYERVRKTDHANKYVASLVKIFRTLPYDRHMLPDGLLRDSLEVVMYGRDSAFSLTSMGAKQLLVIDETGETGAVRTMDRDRYNDLHRRWVTLMRRYRKEKSQVRQAYRLQKQELTSWEFWETYLGVSIPRDE